MTSKHPIRLGSECGFREPHGSNFSTAQEQRHNEKKRERPRQI